MAGGHYRAEELPNGMVTQRYIDGQVQYQQNTPNGWVLANGANGTYDMRGRVTFANTAPTDIHINGRGVMAEIDALKKEVEELRRLLAIKQVDEESYDVD